MWERSTRGVERGRDQKGALELCRAKTDQFLTGSTKGALRFDQFQQVTSIHNVGENYPEIRSLSFVRRVPQQALPAYAKRMQEQALRNWGH